MKKTYSELTGGKVLDEQELFNLKGGYCYAYGCESNVCNTNRAGAKDLCDYVTPPTHVAVNLNWSSMIYPVYAMMLSFFSEPVTIEEACANISSFLSINKEIIVDFINRLLETDQAMHTDFANHTNGFPVNLIIEEEKETFPRVMYAPNKTENFDFPDPRCYWAPKFINNVTHE